MSSKGRKPTGNGEEFYPTDRIAITPLLESDLLILPGGRWIDPCAGTGNIPRVVNSVRSDVLWDLIEIDGRFELDLESLAATCAAPSLTFADFLSPDLPVGHLAGASVAIFNPPFSRALEFVERCFGLAAWVVMLQRSNWFGTLKRCAWLQRHCPDQYTLPKRPSFRPDGKTDSIEYSWFVWPPGTRERRTGRLALLDPPRTTQALLPEATA